MPRYLFNGGPEDLEGKYGGRSYQLKSGEVLEVHDRTHLHLEQGAKGGTRVLDMATEVCQHIAVQLAPRGVIFLTNDTDPQDIPAHIRVAALQAVSDHLDEVPVNFEEMNIEREVAKSLKIARSRYVKDREAMKKKVDKDLAAAVRVEEKAAEKAAKEAQKVADAAAEKAAREADKPPARSRNQPTAGGGR